VLVKVNGPKDEGAKAFMKEHGVPGFPTVLMLKPDGVEIDRIVGFSGDGADYVKKLEAFAAGKDTFLSLTESLANDPDNRELVAKMARKRVARYELEEAVPHFRKLLELDPSDELGAGEEARFYIALSEARGGNPAALETVLAGTDKVNYLKMGYNQLIRIHVKNKDAGKAVAAFEALLAKFSDDTNVMNQFAWTVYENKWADHYDRAIEVAKRAVELEPEAAHIWDTLAWLYVEAGNREAAIAAMEQAVKLDPEQFTEASKKIKGEES